jgi:hypothetical protein
MKKMFFATTAAAALVAVGAVHAEGTKSEAGIGTAVSKGADAAYEKSAQGVNNVKGSYHQNMADSNAKAARDNLAEGDFGSAATNAKDAAEHQASATDAKTKAAGNKAKASSDWAKAKAAVSTSGTTH